MELATYQTTTSLSCDTSTTRKDNRAKVDDNGDCNDRGMVMACRGNEHQDVRRFEWWLVVKIESEKLHDQTKAR